MVTARIPAAARPRLSRHIPEALGTFVVGLLLILAIAAPVVRAPSERIFGADIVGRQHDPFTVMEQIARPIRLGAYSQPVTDVSGRMLARVAGPVAAYNWLVLLSFPLSAAAAYLLARHLALAPAGAFAAALLFAFSPFHLAHAAYHPHIAQTQWLPLYLLALWRCMDDASARAVAWLAVATAAVTLSNFYGGLIAAVITPVAIGAYWVVRARPARTPARHLVAATSTLALLAMAGLAYVWWTAPSVLRDRAGFAFERADLFRYSARWWSYLVPPVAHPLLGGLARRIWSAADVREGLFEQQVSLGWGVVVLGLVAISVWLARDRRHAAAVASVPVCAAVAVAALVCSLSPEWTIGGVTIVRPSGQLYDLAPMFRSYARFGVAVQLMAALLAGVGVNHLLDLGTRPARAMCIALVAVAAAEYAVWPPAFSRDVLPTAAHRWVMRQPDGPRVLDCEPPTPGSASVPWLTNNRIFLLDPVFGDCAEPNLGGRLAAAGYTHLLARDGWERRWLAAHGATEGLYPQARFVDADVLAVMIAAPPVYVEQLTGFSPREHDDTATWRWMGADASWTIVNDGAQPRVVLDIDISAFHVKRELAVRLDGGPAQIVEVDDQRRPCRFGPFALTPGRHQLMFHATAGATIANDVIGNGDPRPLAFAFGAWRWSEQ